MKWLLLILFSACAPASASRTNINEVSDFFPSELHDRADLDKTFKDEVSASKRGIESGSSANDLERELKLEGDLKAKASELSSISAHDLESRGRSARQTECSFYDENELEPNYTEPLVLQHKNDMDHILKGCDSFMSNILSGLKSLGIDCKTIAGSSEQEPEYNVYTEQVASKDTAYDQSYCEQPHHTYSCNYTLTSLCIRPSIAYKDWQAKEIRIPGGELVNSGKYVFNIYKPRDRVFEYELFLKPRRHFFGMAYPDPSHIRGMREFLSSKHPGAQIDNISEDMEGRVEGGTFSINGWYYGGRYLGSKDYAFNYYIVNYLYREGYPICLQWRDTWREGCKVD